MKKIFIAFLFVALVVVAMIPIGQLLYPDDDGGELIVPRDELGGMTLHEVFVENGVSLEDYQLKGTTGTTDWDFNTLNGWNITGENPLGGAVKVYGGGFTNSNEISGFDYDMLYVGIRVKPLYAENVDEIAEVHLRLIENSGGTATIYDGTTIANTPNAYEIISLAYDLNFLDCRINFYRANNYTYFYIDWCYVIDISALRVDKVYSPTNADFMDQLLLDEIRQQLDTWLLQYGLTGINPYLTFNSLGLDTTLTPAEMLTYYNEYLALIS